MHSRRSWAVAAALLLGSGCASLADPDPSAQPSTTSPTTTAAARSTTTTAPKAEGTDGLLTFRGNPTRTFYGTGPMPERPEVLWTFPDNGPMCSFSIDGSGETKWCGTGWTGQPAVVERNGRTWVIFGAYDRSVHFLDGDTGHRLLPDFVTGDLIKGSVTFDPDGYPLIYTGSRDNHFRVIAVDRSAPEELWRLSANDVSPVLWNNDWDGSGLVHDGYLYEGGENSQFHVVELNRSYADDGKVAVGPELAFNAPGWDAELLKDLPDKNVSIESSVAMFGDVVYFANSGGLVQGWDVSKVASGEPAEQVFRYWMGDDVDATVVVDGEGMLYVAAEWERHLPRGREVGQLVKLESEQGRPAGVVGGRPGAGRREGRRCRRHLGHPGGVRGPDRRRHRWGPGHRGRPGHRRRPVDQEPSPPGLAVAGGGRRRPRTGRLPRSPPRLRPARHQDGPARAVDRQRPRVHRVDPGGVEGQDLLRHPRRPLLRGGRPVAPPDQTGQVT